MCLGRDIDIINLYLMKTIYNTYLERSVDTRVGKVHEHGLIGVSSINDLNSTSSDQISSILAINLRHRLLASRSSILLLPVIALEASGSSHVVVVVNVSLVESIECIKASGSWGAIFITESKMPSEMQNSDNELFV